MKRPIALTITAALSLAAAVSCGKDSISSESVTETAPAAEAEIITSAEEQTSAAPDRDTRYTPMFDETGGSSEEAEERLQRKRSIRPDDDGFIIDGTVLLDYDGVASELHIPDGITRIETDAFWSNNSIEALYVPSSVKEIGSSVFWSCPKLRFVDIAEGVEKIDSSSFWSCAGLEDVNLPASLESIYSDVFWANKEVTLHVPAGSYAENFAKYAGFKYDSSPAEFKKSDRINHIRAEQYAHEDFTEFTIPDNITAIDAGAFQYSALESIVIPSNVETIASSAFEYCRSLKTVTIDGCREIKSDAFEYCESLTELRINEGTETIGDSAFAYCDMLTDIYLPESVRNISKRAFEYCNEGLTLHVPAGSYAEDYAAALNIPFDNNI